MTDAKIRSWITLNRPAASGRRKGGRDSFRDATFGAGRWRTAFEWQGSVLSYEEALALYEDAYFEHLRAHPDDLAWLVSTASEVYDNAVSNVDSGLDYSTQETDSTHLQDIAVRRCLERLGRRFEGDHLVEIRGRRSEGIRFNPGQVAFHQPELIIRPEARSWWRPGSVEAFWQSNKVFQVAESAFGGDGPTLVVHLAIQGPGGGLVCVEQDGKPEALPSLVFDGRTGFAGAVDAVLAELGRGTDDMRPTFADLATEDDAVHALMWLPAAQDDPNAPLREFLNERVRSTKLRSPGSQLLKTAIRAGGGVIAAAQR